MLSVDQMTTVSYPSVLNEKRKAANQWAENAAMREFERLGIIKREAIGTLIERSLNYRRNPGAEFLASDLAPTSLAKTDVLTAAQFTPASLSVPLVWSKEDEAKNDTEVAKIKLVSELLSNAIDSHDDLIEEAIFGGTTNGYLGLDTLVPTSGQGTVGGIDSAVETWWRHYAAAYAANTIEADLTAAYNAALKGSGSTMGPTTIWSSADGQATYEASQQTLKRYVDSKEADIGFKVLAFKTARFSFSQYATDDIIGLNQKTFRISVSRSAFRQMGDKVEIPNANGFVKKIFTLLQASLDNKSRLFRLTA
jgi:hypothetical protein